LRAKQVLLPDPFDKGGDEASRSLAKMIHRMLISALKVLFILREAAGEKQ
jgi:hypothetical protein